MLISCARFLAWLIFACNSHGLSDVQRRIDRTKAEQGGLRERDVPEHAEYSQRQLPDHADVLSELEERRESINLVAQTPQYRMQSVQDLQNIPINRIRRQESRNPG